MPSGKSSINLDDINRKVKAATVQAVAGGMTEDCQQLIKISFRGVASSDAGGKDSKTRLSQHHSKSNTNNNSRKETLEDPANDYG